MSKSVRSSILPTRLKEVNDAVADLAGQMLYAAIEKSKALDLVPRPSLGRPGAAVVVD